MSTSQLDELICFRGVGLNHQPDWLCSCWAMLQIQLDQDPAVADLMFRYTSMSRPAAETGAGAGVLGFVRLQVLYYRLVVYGYWDLLLFPLEIF